MRFYETKDGLRAIKTHTATIDEIEKGGPHPSDCHVLEKKTNKDGVVVYVWVESLMLKRQLELVESDWVETEEPKEDNETTILRENNIIKGELLGIDRSSIRDMRELLVEQFPDNPIILKLIDYEAEAKVKRDKLK